MELDLKKFITSILLVGIFMSFDLWTKYEITHSTALHGKMFGIEKKLFIKKPVINYGGAGIFSSNHPSTLYRLWHFFLVLVAAYCFISLVLVNYSNVNKILASIAVGGVWGNVFELMVYGGATDFLQVQGFGFIDDYIFNVADVFIVIGTPLYFITSSLDGHSKLFSLVLFGVIFAVSFGLIPAEPSVFIAVGFLLVLMWWPVKETSER